jgi:hypothetical protein
MTYISMNSYKGRNNARKNKNGVDSGAPEERAVSVSVVAHVV